MIRGLFSAAFPTRALRSWVVFLPVLLVVCSAELSAQDWARFRGPNGSGVSESATVPKSFGPKDYRWKVALPGSGHSSPVIFGDRLFVTAASEDAGQRWIVAIDTAKGSITWKTPAKFSAYKKHKMNSFASSTPAVDAKHVYVLWQAKGASELAAYDRSGEKAWTFDLGPFRAGQGGATSPIVFRDSVVLCNDQEKAPSYLLALDAMTGKEKWKIDRPSDRACFSTPCVFQPPGREPEIIFAHSYRGLTGVDFGLGKKSWEIDVFGTHQQRACGSPIVHDDLVVGSSGFVTAEKNVVAVRPKGERGTRSVAEVFRVTRSAPHVPTPLIYKNRMYLLTDNGLLSAFRMQDGSKVWQGRVGGNYFASPICVGGSIYCMSRRGEVTVLGTGDKFEILSRQKLGEASAATPAVAHGVLYLRTDSQVIAVGGQ